MILEHTTCTVRSNEDASGRILLACSGFGKWVAHYFTPNRRWESLGFLIDDVHLMLVILTPMVLIFAHASRTPSMLVVTPSSRHEDARRQLFERAAKKAREANVDDLDINDERKFSLKVRRANPFLPKKYVKPGYNLSTTNCERNGETGQIQSYVSYMPDHNSPPFFCTFVEVRGRYGNRRSEGVGAGQCS